jgi:cytoskeletal protein RodZ
MSVGTQLAQARRERKLSLSDVTRETKIQPWVLEALEADRLHQLMSPVYVKGFLTTYAKFLHMEPEPLLAALPWPTPEPEETPQQATPAIPAVVSLSLPVLRKLGMAVAVGVLIAGLIALKPQRFVPKASAPRHPAAAPKLASVAPVKDAVKAPEPTSPLQVVVPSRPLELTVTAQRTTWVRVRADGKLLAQQRLERGSNERWTARKRFELVIARPSEVEVELNGQPISSFAIAHRGRLLITHQGITELPEQP